MMPYDGKGQNMLCNPVYQSDLRTSCVAQCARDDYNTYDKLCLKYSWMLCCADWAAALHCTWVLVKAFFHRVFRLVIQDSDHASEKHNMKQLFWM